MNERPMTIRGGAGPYEAAAVVAVIRRTLEEEAALRARRPAPAVPPAWVRRGRPVPLGRFVPPALPDPGINWPA